MTAIVLHNESENKFVDISSEEYRTYTFPGGEQVTITAPQHLAVTAGGHRLLDADQVSHYIPKGWVHLQWKARKGSPHFVK